MIDRPRLIIEKADALVRQLRIVQADERYQGIWTLAHIHGIVYSGPQYGRELDELDAALKAAVPGLEDRCRTCGKTYGQHAGDHCDWPATDRTFTEEC